MKHFYLDSHTKEFCAAKAMWSMLGVVSIFRLAVSGVRLFGVDFPDFDGTEAAAIMAVFTYGYTKRAGDKRDD